MEMQSPRQVKTAKTILSKNRLRQLLQPDFFGNSFETLEIFQDTE